MEIVEQDFRQRALRRRPRQGFRGAGRSEREQTVRARPAVFVAAVARAHPAVRGVEQGLHIADTGELGQVTGSAGDRIVQQQALVGIIPGPDPHAGDVEVVRVTTQALLEPESDRGDDRRNCRRISDGQQLRQAEQHPLRVQGASQRDGQRIGVPFSTQRAPRPVIPPRVRRVALVLDRRGVAAPGAHGEQRRLDLQRGHGPTLAGAASEVHPPQFHLREVPDTEPGAGEVPAGAGSAVGNPHRHVLVELRLGPVLAGIGDRRPGLLDLGEHPVQREHVNHLRDITPGGRPAGRAGCRCPGIVGREHLRVRARRADAPPLQVGVVGSEVHGIDGGRHALGVEGRPRRQFGQRCGGTATVVVGLGVELQILVQEGHGKVQINGLIEQREVRQDPVALQGVDPVLGRELVPAPLDCPQRGTGGAVLGFHVVIGGRRFRTPAQLRFPDFEGVFLRGKFMCFRIPGFAGCHELTGEAVLSTPGGPGRQVGEDVLRHMRRQGSSESGERFLQPGGRHLQQDLNHCRTAGGAHREDVVDEVRGLHVLGEFRPVQEVGAELAVEDLFGGEERSRGLHRAGDHRQRTFQRRQRTSSTLYQRDDQ